MNPQFKVDLRSEWISTVSTMLLAKTLMGEVGARCFAGVENDDGSVDEAVQTRLLLRRQAFSRLSPFDKATTPKAQLPARLRE